MYTDEYGMYKFLLVFHCLYFILFLKYSTSKAELRSFKVIENDKINQSVSQSINQSINQ